MEAIEAAARHGRRPKSEDPHLPIDPEAAAEQSGLHYVSDDMPGIRRRRAGKSFSYRSPGGRLIRDRQERQRIKSLAIPPAWLDVWICPAPRGHLQATGRGDRGPQHDRYPPTGSAPGRERVERTVA